MRKRIGTFRGADILSINETHLKSNEKISLPGYRWLGHNRRKQHVRATRAFGGVGFFIKESVFDNYIVSEEFDSFDDMFGVLFVNKHTDYKFIVYSLYLPPENSNVYNDAPDFFNKLLLEAYRHVELDAIYFVGDINAKIGDLNDYVDIDNVPQRSVLDTTTNNHGKALQEFLLDAKCCLVNGRITRENDNFTFISTRGRSIVDYFFTPHECLRQIECFYVDTCSDIISQLGIESLLSDSCKAPDHSLVTVAIQASPFVQIRSRMLGANNYYQVDAENTAPRYKVRNLPIDFMNSEQVRNVLLQLIDEINITRENQSCVDEMYSKVVNVIHAEMKDKLSPLSKSGKRKNTPYKAYWNENLSKLWKTAHEKESMYTKYKGNRRTKESLRQNFISARNAFDKLLKQRQRAHRRGTLIDIEECNTTDPRQFWKFIQKLGPSKQSSIPWEVYDERGDINSDREYVLNKWKSDYFSLYNDKSNEFDDSFLNDILESKEHMERRMKDPLYTTNPDLNRAIELHEVKKVVDKAKYNKAVGTDGIPNEVLKNEPVIECLHSFFQLCFDSGKIPTVWTQSVISPIPKNRSNDPRVPLNYRGISLISCVYKLYSAILNNRLATYFETNKILHDEQNGFRSKRSCLDHIFTLTSIVNYKLNEDSNVFACFVDFRKAFDLIDRNMLLYRFLEQGIDGKMYEAIKGIYHRAVCAVRINGTVTDWFETSQGTKQGDNLSPNCFSLYLNPLLSELKLSGVGVRVGENLISVLAYADDLVLMAENAKDLQYLIDILQAWCYKWRLSVNVNKTKVVHFRQKNKDLSKFVFSINEMPLEYVSNYKYLGIMLNENMDFSKTAELLAAAAGRALGSVINKVKYNKDLGFKTYITLIDSSVAPILLYGSGVWGMKNFKICEDVLLRACRFYSGVHRLTPIPAIQGDFGWLDCRSRWKLESIRLYNRFLCMDSDRLNKKMFLLDKHHCSNNWSQNFKKLLTDLSLEEHWGTNGVIPLDLAKTKVKDQFTSDWKHHCSTKSKLRTYVTFKDNVNVASHLNSNLPKYERSLISQLRCGILPLRIETGRYVNLAEKDRLCQLCQQQRIENEAHFLFECDIYSTDRTQLEATMNCRFLDMDTADKFKSVFKHPYALGTFMKSAIQKRRNLLYKS